MSIVSMYIVYTYIIDIMLKTYQNRDIGTLFN